MSPIYVFDSTAHDSLSQVRGIGRYMQILHEHFGNEYTFTSDIKAIPLDATFINPFFNFLATPLITKRIAKKQIAVIHDLIPLKYPKHFPIGIRGNITLYRNKLALKQYDAIITDSDASKKDIISILNVDEKKIHVIYPVVTKIFNNHSPVEAISYKPPATSYCIYVGDATWNKNLLNLARAIQIADIACVFVGKVFSSVGANRSPLEHPWQKELQEFLKIAHPDPRFIFPGFVPDDVLIDLYKNAVCNTLVSHDEGFGFSYLEAAALGMPSVLSDIAVLHETAADSALFANPNDPTEIAKKIQEFTSNDAIRKQYAEASKKRSDFFNAERFKNDLHAICLQ